MPTKSLLDCVPEEQRADVARSVMRRSLRSWWYWLLLVMLCLPANHVGMAGMVLMRDHGYGRLMQVGAGLIAGITVATLIVFIYTKTIGRSIIRHFVNKELRCREYHT